MTLDVEKTKKLIDIFSRLNEENQEAVLVKAFQLEIEQNSRSNIQKLGKPSAQDDVDEHVYTRLKEMDKIMKLLDDAGPTGQAAMVFLMDRMTNGEFTKEENIDFSISVRKLSASEYIEKYIPDADIERAKELYRSLHID